MNPINVPTHSANKWRCTIYFQDTFLRSEIKEIQSNQYLDEQVLLIKTIQKKYFFLGLRVIRL